MWKVFGVLLVCLAPIYGDDSLLDTINSEVLNRQYKWINAETDRDVRKLLLQRILTNMNASVDPCDNFYEYACGNYLSNVPKPPESVTSFNDYEYVNLLHKVLIEKLLQDPVDEFDYESEVKAKTLYKNCVEGTYSTLAPIIIEMGIRSPDESENISEFDIRNVALKAFDFNVRIYLELAKRSYLKSSSEYAGFIASLHKIDVLLIDIDTESLALTMFNIENDLSVIPKPREDSLPMEISEFMELVDEALVWYNPKEVNDYFFFLVYDILYRDLKSVNIVKKCTEYVVEHMMEPVLSMYIRKYMNVASYIEVHNMLERIVEEEKKMVQESQWISREVADEIARTLNISGKVVGFPYNILNESLINDMYQSFSPHEIRLTFREKGRYLSEIESYMIASAPAEYPLKVELKLGLLQPPFFHHYFPRFYNYGNLGKIIGSQYAYIFGTESNLFSGEGNRAQDIDYITAGRYQQLIGCFLGNYGRMKTIDKISINAYNVLSKIIADNIGLSLAYKAYNKWIEDLKVPDIIELKDFEDLHMDRKQAFFVSAAQSFCNTRYEPYDRKDDHIPDYLTLFGMFSNSKDFIEAFKCPRRARMNKGRKCDFTEN